MQCPGYFRGGSRKPKVIALYPVKLKVHTIKCEFSMNIKFEINHVFSLRRIFSLFSVYEYKKNTNKQLAMLDWGNIS